MRLQLFLQASMAFFATSASALVEKRSLSTSAQSLFDYAMSINDPRFDESYKFVIYPDTGPWSVRFTACLACQQTDSYNSVWYGTWKLSPDEPTPTPDSPLYPPSIYNTYDPNWREFIGTQLVQIVEEFPDLIGEDLIAKIITAMEIQAVGAMRRNGTNGDNLVTAYTNPGLMRALTVGWTGARTNNQTLIDYANTKAAEITQLFKDGPNAFSEYNALTYYGMDIWALGANIKYGPKNATMTLDSPFLLTEMWADIAEHYNAYLGNFVGPYDRANSRDLTQHSAALPLWFWGMFGYENAPEPNKLELDLLYDATQGSALALLVSTIEEHINATTKAKLQTPPTATEERFLNKTIRESLYNDTIRTATSWMSQKLMIGGEELAEEVARSGQFVPAIVHWAADASHLPFPYNGFFSLYPSATTITAVATKNKLEISYPNITQAGTSSFQFMLSNIPPTWNLAGNVVDGFSTLPCLNASVLAPGLELQPTTYGDTIYDHIYYNITYAVPANFTGIPKITFDLEYTC
ncbi:hypothetical protein G7Y89_g9829 [Cudoniella acicularis]|uniref:Uncharacterized protein n=1 Tax=Cudoniella acicularis TaxID=354080 RepID=A0A8H4RDX4_9HELO|nr:hypothetical protein G7Y89_g9829 [Cudoniella acicularis]